MINHNLTELRPGSLAPCLKEPDSLESENCAESGFAALLAQLQLPAIQPPLNLAGATTLAAAEASTPALSALEADWVPEAPGRHFPGTGNRWSPESRPPTDTLVRADNQSADRTAALLTANWLSRSGSADFTAETLILSPLTTTLYPASPSLATSPPSGSHTALMTAGPVGLAGRRHWPGEIISETLSDEMAISAISGRGDAPDFSTESITGESVTGEMVRAERLITSRDRPAVMTMTGPANNTVITGGLTRARFTGLLAEPGGITVGDSLMSGRTIGQAEAASLPLWSDWQAQLAAGGSAGSAALIQPDSGTMTAQISESEALKADSLAELAVAGGTNSRSYDKAEATRHSLFAAVTHRQPVTAELSAGFTHHPAAGLAAESISTTVITAHRDSPVAGPSAIDGGAPVTGTAQAGLITGALLTGPETLGGKGSQPDGLAASYSLPAVRESGAPSLDFEPGQPLLTMNRQLESLSAADNLQAAESVISAPFPFATGPATDVRSPAMEVNRATLLSQLTEGLRELTAEPVSQSSGGWSEIPPASAQLLPTPGTEAVATMADSTLVGLAGDSGRGATAPAGSRGAALSDEEGSTFAQHPDTETFAGTAEGNSDSPDSSPHAPEAAGLPAGLAASEVSTAARPPEGGAMVTVAGSQPGGAGQWRPAAAQPADNRPLEVQVETTAWGRVQISARESGEAVLAQVVVSSQPAWQALRAAEGEMRESFTAQGLQLGSFEVAYQGGGQQQQRPWPATEMAEEYMPLTASEPLAPPAPRPRPAGHLPANQGIDLLA